MTMDKYWEFKKKEQVVNGFIIARILESKVSKLIKIKQKEAWKFEATNGALSQETAAGHIIFVFNNSEFLAFASVDLYTVSEGLWALHAECYEENYALPKLVKTFQKN